MRKKVIATAVGVAALGITGVAFAGGNGGTAGQPASRLDDGKDLLSQASITEAQATAAAQGAASGDLNEVDLEQFQGTLAYNVDVGQSDVKVDAHTGRVLDVSSDD
jgi:uncharacterized membrane protein YkoI